MEEYRNALLAAQEKDYDLAIESINRGLEATYSLCKDHRGQTKAHISSEDVLPSPAHPVLLLSSLHTLHGGVLYRQQRWDDSLREYGTASKLLKVALPTTTRIQTAFLANCIGKCHMHLGEHTKAIVWLERGIKELLSASMSNHTLEKGGPETGGTAADASILLASLHTTLSLCYMHLGKRVEALVHAKFVHRRLGACCPDAEDYARASVLLAECTLGAAGGNRDTFTKVLELLNNAAKVYKRLIRAPQDGQSILITERRDLILWLINVYYLTSRVLLIINCKRDAELYAYKAEKLLQNVRVPSSDAIYCRINKLIYVCQHGVPQSTLIRSTSPNMTIADNLYDLMDSILQERLSSDPDLSEMFVAAAKVLENKEPMGSKSSRRATSAPLIANPTKYNCFLAEHITDMDRKARATHDKKSCEDPEDPEDQLMQIIQRYKTTDIRPHVPLNNAM